MTCKECIHYGVCEKRERLMLMVNSLYELTYQNNIECSCGFFKNKSDFAEVVRCQNCYYCKESDKMYGFVCTKRNCETYFNEFCSNALRRGNDDL